MNKAFKANPAILEAARFNQFISGISSMTKDFKRLTKEVEINTLKIKLSLLR